MSEEIFDSSASDELKRRNLPELLKFADGRAVDSEELWNERRAEIAEILQHNYCGYEPPIKAKVTGNITKEDERTAWNQSLPLRESLCGRASEERIW